MGIDCYGINPNCKRSEMAEPFWLLCESLDKGPATFDELQQIDEDYIKKNSLSPEIWSKILEDQVKNLTHGGVIFSNKWSWWHTLWNFVCEVGKDILTDEQIALGHTNSGIEITEKQCVQLSEKINEQINSGYVRELESKSKNHYDSLPKEPCKGCKGTGLMETIQTKEKVKCIICGGDEEQIKGDWDGWEPFSEDNVRTFSLFLKNCGGFVID